MLAPSNAAAFLLRQRLGSHYPERPRHRGRSCIRLTSANRHRIGALRNDWLACLAHHAQIPFLQFESHFLRFAWSQVHALEAAQSSLGGSRHIRKAEVKLGNFIALPLS